MSEVVIERLACGLTLLIEELPRPVAACQLLLPGGSAIDPVGREGAATLLHRFLGRGAGERDTRAFAEALDGLGTHRGGGPAQTATSLSLVGLADDWVEAFGLLADLVLRPRLPQSELEPCRQIALQELAGLDDEPRAKMSLELQQRFLPGPVGRRTLGTVEGLGALTHAELAAHHQATFRPDGAILAVCGGVPADTARRTVDRLLGDWAGAPPATPDAVPAAEPSYQHVTQETEQVQLGVAYRDVPPGDPADYHSSMAVEVLSGGMGARLFTEVREKRGLCYSVGAGRRSLPGCGWVVASAGTTTERSSETLEVLVAELRRLPGTVTDEEIDRARTGWLSNMVMTEESTSARVGRIVSDYYRLGRVRTSDEMRAGIEAVSTASLNEHLSARPPGALTVVTLGSEFTWPAGLSL